MSEPPGEVLLVLAKSHGRTICREPQRLEAILRDRCPAHKREIFLLTAAAREQVVAELVVTADQFSDEVLIAKGARKLCDGLGLSEEAARWAVETWLPASRVLAAGPDFPLPLELCADWTDPDSTASEIEIRSSSAGVNWGWMALCGGAITCAASAIGAVLPLMLHRNWFSFTDWLVETGGLAAGLLLCALGLGWISRRLRARPIPNQRQLPRDQAAGAMLVEVLVLAVLPLVPPAIVVFWVGEWMGVWQLAGPVHDLSFHLGRMLQSLVIGVFLVRWVLLTARIAGRIAFSMVNRW
jgi:hypothetical protein